MVAIDAKESLAADSDVACTDAACAGATGAAGAAQKSEVLLSLERAKKSFGDNQVLKDITLQVEKGQVVSIIGPSGGGKSTLLRCATMLEKMDDGELVYLGQKVTAASTRAELKKIRSCFENFRLRIFGAASMVFHVKGEL